MVQHGFGLRFRKFWLGLMLAMSLAAGAASEVAAKDGIKIVAFGDSLTAGYGVAPDDAFPAQLGRALGVRGHKVEILNAGVSGDTAAAGLERFDWAIPDDADAVILELGANDGLRGIDPQATRAALDQILVRLQARKLPVLLAGMRAPKNWGEAYATQFDGLFGELATQHGALLYPFFLDGVVMDKGLNQADGIHPTAKGVAVIVAKMLPMVEVLVAKVGTARQ